MERSVLVRISFYTIVFSFLWLADRMDSFEEDQRKKLDRRASLQCWRRETYLCLKLKFKIAKDYSDFDIGLDIFLHDYLYMIFFLWLADRMDSFEKD